MRAVPAEERWADELMILILRAMVRGQDRSFVSSRTDASPDGIRHFREELTRLYHRIQHEVVALPVYLKHARFKKTMEMRMEANMEAMAKNAAEIKQYSASEVRALKWFSAGLVVLCGLSLLLVLYVQLIQRA